MYPYVPPVAPEASPPSARNLPFSNHGDSVIGAGGRFKTIFSTIKNRNLNSDLLINP